MTTNEEIVGELDEAHHMLVTVYAKLAEGIQQLRADAPKEAVSILAELESLMMDNHNKHVQFLTDHLIRLTEF